MRRRSILLWLWVTQLLLATAAFGQSYKAEATGTPPPDVPKPLQDMLQAQGAKLVSDQGATVAEIWLRKDFPAKQVGATSDVLYGALGDGSVVGVLHFPQDTADYRAQTIKAGFYTLRHALIPQDGNHMGVNPYRDALLLAPVAADTEITKDLSYAEMVSLSRKASGTPHPGFLILAPAKDGQDTPAAFQDDQGHWDLQLKLHGPGGDLPIAITLVGKFEA
jgi:hypothetical protein